VLAICGINLRRGIFSLLDFETYPAWPAALSRGGPIFHYPEAGAPMPRQASRTRSSQASGNVSDGLRFNAGISSLPPPTKLSALIRGAARRDKIVQPFHRFSRCGNE